MNTSGAGCQPSRPQQGAALPNGGGAYDSIVRPHQRPTHDQAQTLDEDEQGPGAALDVLWPRHPGAAAD